MIIRYGLTGILFWLLVIFSAYESMAQKESGKIKCICIYKHLRSCSGIIPIARS